MHIVVGVLQPPFYCNHLLFAKKTKSLIYFVLFGVIERLGGKESFGNWSIVLGRNFNTGSGAVFGYFLVILKGT